MAERIDPVRTFAKFFPNCPSEALFTSTDPWPSLQGCLTILFANRSGSTFLSREIERHYRMGHIGESFNPKQLLARAKQGAFASPASAFRYTVRSMAEDGWFGVKAGPVAIACAERAGFVDAYLPRTRFILLFRRDIVAQAVSAAKADVTGRFHSSQPEAIQANGEDYDRNLILTKAKSALESMQMLDAWLRRRDAAKGKLFYEDFENGDFQTIAALCNSFGLPMRSGPRIEEKRIVTKIGDAVNEEWCNRFRDESDGEVADILAQFETLTRA